MKIIKSPIVTEKTLRDYQTSNKVTFEVDGNTNKIEATKVLESVYGVKVAEARVNNRLGKIKYSRFSKRFSRLPSKKIVVFTLEKGSKLDLFETK
jgi:ribosomal protein L23